MATSRVYRIPMYPCIPHVQTQPNATCKVRSLVIEAIAPLSPIQFHPVLPKSEWIAQIKLLNMNIGRSDFIEPQQSISINSVDSLQFHMYHMSSLSFDRIMFKCHRGSSGLMVGNIFSPRSSQEADMAAFGAVGMILRLQLSGLKQVKNNKEPLRMPPSHEILRASYF